MVDYLQEEYQRLRKKGWTEEEVGQTLNILKKENEHKSFLMLMINKVIFWAALLMLIVGNMTISVVLIPFMLMATPILLYPGLIFMGLTFGALYTIVIHDIEQIDDTPKIMPELFIPAIALINIYIMTVLSNQLALILKLQLGIHTPIIVALAYVGGFVTPLVYTKLRLSW